MEASPILPRIGVSMGDPAGIGPELVLRLLAIPPTELGARLLVYGSSGVLEAVADHAELPWPTRLEMADPLDPCASESSSHALADTNTGDIEPGKVQMECGALAAAWIRQATRDALAGRTAAIVTAPINKSALQLAGEKFPGHTEMLAHLCGVTSPRMFFWSPELAVGLVTIHVALKQVPRLITRDSVYHTIVQIADATFGPDGAPPRIGILGLNPHAGEDGIFGDEELSAIAPAIAAARAAGIDARGPLVPDTALRREARANFDAFVAMYHDQGLIPFKMIAFDSGVNVTLGLPFCRTSPDHGTAFDIAWQGKASPDSMLAAVEYARLAALRRPSNSKRGVPAADMPP